MMRRLPKIVRMRRLRRLRAGVEPRPRGLRRRRGVWAAIAVVLAVSASALAFWAASGSGTAGGSVGTLNAPTEASAASTSGSSTVAVSWTASTPANGLSPTGYYVKRWNGGTPTVAGGTCGSPASPVNQTSCSDTSVADGTYTYTVVAVYHSWTAESAHSSAVTVLGDATPPTDSLSLSGASGAYLTGETLYFKGDSVGQFGIIDTVSDSGSGPASASFPTLSATNWTTHAAETVSTPAGGPYASSTFKWSAGAATPTTYTVTSKDNAGNTSAGSTLTFVSDTTAPTSGAVTVNGGAATGAGSTSTSTSTSFTIGSRTDYADGGSGLASSTLTIQSETFSNNVCGAPGSGGAYTSPTTISGTTNPAITTGFCYLYTLAGTDNVGNTASVSTTVKVDTTAPTTPTLTFTGLSSNASYSSGQNTLYFRPAAGGTYTVNASSTDAESGIVSGNAGYTFSSLSTNNFTGTQTGGQNAYTFGATATQPASDPTVFATSNAGSSSANASYKLVSDTSAPTGGALSVNGTGATVGGSASTSIETGFAIGSRTDYTETQSASQSGLASSTLTIQSETLTGNTCGAPGSGGKYTSATTISGTTQPTIETGFCYLYALTGTDNVGNAASVKTTVKVDATAPSSPTVSLSSATGNTFISGTTVYINAQAGKEGSFKATASSTDAETGVTSIKLPSLTGFSEGGGTLSSPFETKYKWSGAVAASGAQSVTATNGFGVTTTNSSAFTVTPDTTAPTGGAVSVNGTAATAGGSTSTSTETGFAIGSRTDYAEAQTVSASGLASSTLTIQSETLTGNTCGAPGSGGKYTSATTISGTTQPTIETGFCYLYALTGTDNVGNAASVKTTVKVDTTAPSSPTVSLSSATGNTFISGTTVYINAQAGKEGSFKATASSTDAETGVTSIKLPSLTGFSEGGGTLSSPFETKYKWSGAVGASGAQSVTATNGFGLTTTNSSAFIVTPDTTVPSSAGTVTVPARVHAASVSVTFSGAADAGSGISTAAGELLRAEATYTVGTDTCGSFGGFAKVGSAGQVSPFSDTTVVNNKCYEYEYKASDNVGNTTTSGASGAVKVDTTAPKASTITAVNGTGATLHKTDAKDVVTYTFSENIDPSSITSAWSVGSSPDQTVTMTFKDNPTEGNGTNKPDFFEVTTAGVHLGSVEMSNGNWVTTQRGSYSFSSTMHFATVEGKTVITITLTSLNAGGNPVGEVTASDTFKWTPDAAIADLAGNAADTATKAENSATHF